VTPQQGLPQLILNLLATEMYNPQEDAWYPWADYDESITGYLLLVYLDDKNQPFRFSHYENIMAVTGWDGESFAGLDKLDLTGKIIQFEVYEDGEYGFKVKQIAAEDGVLGGLRKLDDKDLAALDRKFSTGATGKKNTPAKKPKPKPTRKPPSVVDAVLADVGPCTVDEAWDACVAANEGLVSGAVPEKILEDYWRSRVQEIALESDNITGAEASLIRNGVLSDLGVAPAGDDIPF